MSLRWALTHFVGFVMSLFMSCRQLVTALLLTPGLEENGVTLAIPQSSEINELKPDSSQVESLNKTYRFYYHFSRLTSKFGF